MALLISIDTSSNISYVSIFKDGKIFTASNSSENSHSEEIESLVGKVVKEAKVEFDELDGIVLGAGPGSFTGLRIGAAYAKGLAMSLKKPIFQYSALQSSVQILEESSRRETLALMDAGRKEYFVASEKIELCIMNWESIQSFMKESRAKWTVFTAGFKLPEGAPSYELSHFPPLSEAILRVHLQNPCSSSGSFSTTEIADLSPLYLRQVAAKTLKERGIDC